MILEPTDLLARTERQSRFHALKVAEAEALSRMELAAGKLAVLVTWDQERSRQIEAATAVAHALEVLAKVRESLTEQVLEEATSTLESVKGLL